MTKVLIVDDMILNRELLRKVLEKEGIKTDEAINGKEALFKISQEQFDLVLMDLMMPVMNGFEAIEAIRQHLHQEMPIVVISSLNDEESMARVKELGANAYLTKPFHLIEMLKIIKGVLSVQDI